MKKIGVVEGEGPTRDLPLQSQVSATIMKFIRRAGVDCSIILFGQPGMPTNDLSLQCNVLPTMI